MEFTDAQVHRYARHILLPEVGGEGQARLLASRVLVIGAGGLGSPLLLYLAAAGVGTIGVVDDDDVDLSNLQRQVVHTTDRIGTAKVESARLALAGINPEVRLVPHRARFAAGNAAGLVSAYDLVADGSDNFATRFLAADACFLAGKPLVSAAVLRFDGQLSTFKPYLAGDHPCYRCLFREPPPPDYMQSCANAGVLGAMTGAMGALQAGEVIKELLGIGESLSGWLLIFDALATSFRKVRLHRDPSCRLCGRERRITDLSHHRATADAG
ncbi:MAG: molybdopterin-synthase adenylyltransferase MoeB [Proteobacteria bacterium]|nr:molybdopterin-synthase adenylyltransferase MoeB [Pseudomonadota bacterium]